MPTLRARRPRRLTSLALAPAAALLVALVGCSDSTTIPDADPAPSVSPMFASEEEALEAATAVYEEYNATADQVGREGGANPERLQPLLSPELYTEEIRSIQEFVDSGIMTEGASRTTGVKLQQVQNGPPGIASVTFYACSVNDQVVVVDQSGAPAATQPPVVEVTLEVTVESRESGKLFISDRDFWAEGNQCDV